MKDKLLLPIKLQFFAEDGQGDTGTGDTGTGSQDNKDNAGDNGSQPKTFDDLLKADKNYQSEFDKRITKALETAKGKWDADAQQKIADAKTEAEKLAKMNADQKAQYERDKQEADFNKRLSDLTTRELKAEAKETLASEGLPLELAEVLNYTDADTCKKSIEAVKTAFQASVENAVNEKLKGKGIPKAGTGSADDLQTQIAKAMRGQI